MPSTYSTSLGLELIGNGEQAGTWGTTTNTNLGTLLEQAIAGVESITLVGGDYTLTDYNGLPDQARNAVLVFGGLLAAPCNVIAPAVEKVYIVRNFSNATVTVKTSGGNGVAIANAASEVIFCDGTNVFSATQFNYIDGNLTVSANVTVGGNIAIAGNSNTAGNAVFLKNVFGNASTDQWYLPRGNTAARTASPITGVIRYNTEANFYEGYANGSWVRFLVANQGSYTITYLVIGGGGGSASDLWQGGGGAGQFTASTTPAIPGTTVLTITIGAGGALGSNGSTTQITGVGQGIGGGNGYGSGTYGYGGISGGNSGNGFTGGSNQTPVALGFGNSGGGAGSSANGGSGSSSENVGQGGNGGAGTETLITGTSQTLAGGGGGGGQTAGGTGVNGGGNGSANGAGGSSGTPNTGGGGGGGHQGGSGVVFLSMPTINYTGTTTGSPTITTTGSNTVLKFTGSGTYTA
jgi:hypothetical protein